MVMQRHSHRIDADYTEDFVGIMIELLLAVMSFPRCRFSIELFSRSNERWLGADARLLGMMRGFRPFYMQFKRPSAYPDFSSAGLIQDRKALQLRVSPRTLFFGLRAKKAHHLDFQHNILFRLRRRLRDRQLGDAAYVCPLFLKRSAYRFRLHRSALSLWLRFWRHYPWELEEVLLNNGGNATHFDRIPVLVRHMTVPPHDIVTTAKHCYSFTEAGTELCFHSPEALPDGAASLAAFLSKVSEGFLDGGEKIQPQRANEELRQLIDAVEAGKSDDLSFEIEEDNPIGNWLAWGDYLRLGYGIDHYALVRWRD